MKPENENSRNQSDESKKSNTHTPETDESTDFLGSNHGNAMPEPETAPDKTLNPEESSNLKSKDRPELE